MINNDNNRSKKIIFEFFNNDTTALHLEKGQKK